ncbi:hypothetical protein D3C80_1810870 [compost metagenome]
MQIVEVGPLRLSLNGEDRRDDLGADNQGCVAGLLLARVPGITVGLGGLPVVVTADDQRAAGKTLAHGLAHG